MPVMLPFEERSECGARRSEFFGNNLISRKRLNFVMLFEIIDRKGRKVRLTEAGLKHIKTDHPDVNIEEIKLTLEMPTKITTSKYDENVKWYYRFNKAFSEYLLVAVKYLNGMLLLLQHIIQKR